MRNILKIEKIDILKMLAANFIDLVLAVGFGCLLFYCVFTPIFNAGTDINQCREYIASVEKVESTDQKRGYDLTLDLDLTYEKYILEGKSFFEYYEEKLTTYYFETASNSESIKEEYKERFKDIHLIFNYIFLGLDYRADASKEESYSNSYFIYKMDSNGNPIWNEYAIDNPRTLELNKRGIAERQQFVVQAYQNLPSILSVVDDNYVLNTSKVNNYIRFTSLASTSTSIIVFYLIMPLVLKNYATIGKRIFGYGYINKNGTKVSWWKGPLKTFIASIFPTFGLFFFNIYTIILLAVAPYFLNMIYFVLASKDRDILDLIFRMEIIDIKNSLFFASKEEEEEYLKNEKMEDYDESEKEYTDMLSNITTLDIKSVEEKIEDEQRLSKNGK